MISASISVTPQKLSEKKQGICIETTVLFASILERLGFETSIILTSTHAFVGWLIEDAENGEVIDLIETTMIGDANISPSSFVIKQKK